jgi:hypothetical protein
MAPTPAYPLNPISFSVAKMIDHEAKERRSGRWISRKAVASISTETGLAEEDVRRIAGALEIKIEQTRPLLAP